MTSDLLLTAVLAVGIAALLVWWRTDLFCYWRELRNQPPDDLRLGWKPLLVWFGLSVCWVWYTRHLRHDMPFTGLLSWGFWRRCLEEGIVFGGLGLWAMRRWRRLPFPVYSGEYVWLIAGMFFAVYFSRQFLMECGAGEPFHKASVIAECLAIPAVCCWAMFHVRGMWKLWFLQYLPNYPNWLLELSGSAARLPGWAFDEWGALLLLAAVVVDLSPGRRLPWTHWLGVCLILEGNTRWAWEGWIHRGCRSYELPLALSGALIVAVLRLLIQARDRSPQLKPEENRAPTPWFYFGTLSVCFVQMQRQAYYEYHGELAMFATILAACAALAMIVTLVRRPPRYSLRTMFLITTLVALAISGAQSVGGDYVLAVLVPVGWLVIAWTHFCPKNLANHLRP